MNIAVFGGTFDPPTRAHEAIIDACLQRSDIEQVWVMPSGQRTDKPGMTSDLARLSMLHILKQEVYKDDSRLIVSDFECGLPRPTHTYETIRALALCYPRHDFKFVYGADSYHAMGTWQGGTELKQKIGMLLVPRVGFELPKETERLQILNTHNALAGISSTEVREMIREGLLPVQLLNPLIGQFIVRHGLYSGVTMSG